MVSGDVTRLTQIVVNVLTNAARYRTARTDRVTARPLDEDVELRIRDTGIGISAEMLPKIFDLFTQERQPLDRARRARPRVDDRAQPRRCGGTIEAQRRPQSGQRVRDALPQ